MKKIFALLAVVALTFSGCKTPEQNQALILLFSIAAKDATYLGITADLKAHPEHRPAVVASRDALRTVVNTGTINGDTLLAILNQLPVKEFQGQKGQMIVGDIVLIVDQFGALLKLKDNQAFNSYGLPIANAIERGLTLALGE